MSQAADMGMEHCAFDPSGSVLAVAGRRGYVHLIDWRSGAAQVVGSVKMNSGVQSLWWNRHSGSDASSELMTLGADAERWRKVMCETMEGRRRIWNNCDERR